MTGLLACLSAAVLGVDYGWQPIAGGGIEYIIQIEPQMLDALTRGEDLSSALPPAARNIRRYRIVAGNAPLPHHGEPLPIDPGEEPAAKRQSSSAEVSPVRYDRLDPADDAARKLSMPLRSPYPDDYETSGIPLPGPAHAPPPLVRPQLTSVVEEPAAAEIAAEPEAADSRVARQPLADRDKPSIWTSAAKPSTNFSPMQKPQGSEAGKRRPPSQPKETHGAKAGKPSPAERTEPLSPSEQPAPKSNEQVSDNTGSAALVGLFASLGGNVFLIWVATGQRHRYRSLLRRSHEASAGELPRADDDDSPTWDEVPADEDSAEE